MEFISKWINMLRGKKVESSDVEEKKNTDTEQQQVSEQQKSTDKNNEEYYIPGEKTTEDSVVKDLKNAESFAKQVVDKVKQAPIPLPEIPKKSKKEPSQIDAQQARSRSEQSSPPKSTKLSNALLGKIIRLIVILVLIFILVFVLFSLLRMLNGGDQESNGVDPVVTGEQIKPTATPVTYKPYVPSVYAKDPEILQIEEDVSVLDAELFRADIDDPVIKPPNLDFNISF